MRRCHRQRVIDAARSRTYRHIHRMIMSMENRASLTIDAYIVMDDICRSIRDAVCTEVKNPIVPQFMVDMGVDYYWAWGLPHPDVDEEDYG